MRACVVALGGRAFAVEMGCARELVVIEDYTRVPLAPSSLVGVTNLRGHVLPLVDIRPLLGLPAHGIGRGSLALVVEADAVQAAIVIEEVLGLSSFDGTRPRDAAEGQPAGEVGVELLPRGDTPVTLLDTAKILEGLRRGREKIDERRN
ncbi:MAG: chemotaxis protein CheW [Candidatus Rokuibacteriota bacterium]